MPDQNKPAAAASPARRPTVVVTPFLCPLCQGKPREDGCLHCARYGLVDETETAGWEPHELVRMPDPPGVMKHPCGGCATRFGSPEHESDPENAGVLDPDKPFWCHKGMPLIEGHYTPIAWYGDMPLGALLCRGWWDWRLTGKLPGAAYRQEREQDFVDRPGRLGSSW